MAATYSDPYGIANMSDEDLNSLIKASGMGGTPDVYRRMPYLLANAQLGAVNPPAGQGPTTYNTGASSGFQQGGIPMSSLLEIAQVGGGGRRQAPAPAPSSQQLAQNPLYQASALGAAALNMPMVINPTPSGEATSKTFQKGGVNQPGGPIVGTGVPQVGWNWDTVAHAAGLSSDQISPYIKSGQTPAQAAQQLGLGQGSLAGPWSTTPGVFTPAARPTPTQTQPMGWSQVAQAAGLSQADIAQYQAAGRTPQQIAQQFNVGPSAGPYAPTPQPTAAPVNQGVPFATAPPAPGMPQFPAARATPAATPAPYTGSVHDDPFMSHAVSAMMGWPTSPNPWGHSNPHAAATTPAATGANVALATEPPPKRMQSGGYVNGKGDDDTVPALLTPGEYVLNRQQVNQASRGRTVNLGKLPSEVPRATTATPAASATIGDYAAKPPAGTSPQAHNAMVADTVKNNLATNLSAYFGARANPNASLPGMAASSQPVQAMRMGLNPNAGLPAGTSGYLSAPGQPVGPAPGTGSQMTPQGASAISGIADAINQAAQKWASSIGSWQPQASAIPNPDDYRRQQPITFSQTGVV